MAKLVGGFGMYVGKRCFNVPRNGVFSMPPEIPLEHYDSPVVIEYPVVEREGLTPGKWLGNDVLPM